MIIIGAGGLASELLQVCTECDLLQGLHFYDNINPNSKRLFDEFPILKNELELSSFFKSKSKKFILGIGNPDIRKKLALDAEQKGGELYHLISPRSIIGNFNTLIEEGATILPNAIVSNNCYVGRGALIYYGSTIAHDCKIGQFCELSPGATLLGRVSLGDNVHVGANATILPKVKIGNNVIIGAGSVVTKDVPSNSIIKGVPAK